MQQDPQFSMKTVKKLICCTLFGYVFCYIILQGTGLRNTDSLDISRRAIVLFMHQQCAHPSAVSATSCKNRASSPSAECLTKLLTCGWSQIAEQDLYPKSPQKRGILTSEHWWIDGPVYHNPMQIIFPISQFTVQYHSDLLLDLVDTGNAVISSFLSPQDNLLWQLG